MSPEYTPVFCLLVEGCCGVPGPICHPRHNDIPDSKAFVTQLTGDRSDSMLFILFTTLEYLCSAQSNIPLCSIRPPTQIQMLRCSQLTIKVSPQAPPEPRRLGSQPPLPVHRFLPLSQDVVNLNKVMREMKSNLIITPPSHF